LGGGRRETSRLGISSRQEGGGRARRRRREPRGRGRGGGEEGETERAREKKMWEEASDVFHSSEHGN